MGRNLAFIERLRGPLLERGRDGGLMTHFDGLYQALQTIHARPELYAQYTAPELWDDSHISERMLALHLDDAVPLASRPRPVRDQSVAWLTDRFALAPGRRVLDLGCGPGLYASGFARTGAAVVGLDVSRRSIAYAKAQAGAEGLEVEYEGGSYLEVELGGPYDLVTLIDHDFCALPPDARRALLDRVRAALAEGGAFAFDAVARPGFEARAEGTTFGRDLMEGFWAPPGYWGFSATHLYSADSVALDLFTIVEADRVRRFYNWMRYYDSASLGEELAEAGFEVQDCFRDFTGAPYDPAAEVFAVVASRSTTGRGSGRPG